MAKHFLISVGALTGSRVFVALSQVIVLPILARNLDSAQFGDVALSMTVVLFAQLLSDAGLGRSLIRRPSFDPREWNAVFWLLVALGLMLALVLLAIAPIWSWIYQRPTIGPLVAALSVVPLISSVSAVPTAILERQHKFPALATNRTCAALAGVATAACLAIAGAGVWALIGQQITIVVLEACGAFAISGYRPMSPKKRAPLREHVVFARNTLGVSLLMTAQRQLPLALIGYVLGSASLGFFSMSQRIHNLPSQGIAGPTSRVAYVHMCAAQSAPGRVADIYLGSIFLLAMVILPPVAVLIGVGHTAFPLLLSEHWRPVATIFALAAPGIAIEACTSHAGVLLQALNRTELRLRMALERMLLRVCLVLVALPFGLEAAAAAVSISALCFLPRQWSYVGRAVPFSKTAALRTLLGPLAVAAMLWTLARQIELHTSGWATLGFGLLLLLLTWGAIGLLMRRRLQTAVTAFST